MDRNTVIGIVLILAIMILWPFYSQMVAPLDEISTPRIDSTRVHRDTGELGKTRDSLVSEAKTIAKIQIAKDTSKIQRRPEQVLSIETDLYSTRISSRGGRFLNWFLKLYTTQNDDAVNPVDSTVNFNITLKYKDQLIETRELDWTFSTFDPIVCQGSQTQDFTMVAPIDSIRRIVAQYRVTGNTYDLALSVRFEGFGDEVPGGEYSVEWKSGMRPVENNVADEILYQKAYAMLGEDKEEYDVDDQAEISYSGTTKWISTRNKYFALFIIPLAEDGVSARFSGMNITESDHIVNRLYSIGLGMKFSPGKAQDFKLYIGPTDYTLLASYEENLNVIVEWGWAIFRPFTKAIFYTFRFLYDVIPNYGWVIIVFALLVKLLLWPLTHKSYVGMQKMKEVMPRQKALQEKYKGNPTKLQQEMMKLYKEVGYNPLSGCLPMLIQIPILFPIYQVFRESIDLRQAPWFGWIHDLSLPDTIYVARTGLPLIGDFNINPLPIIMTILTFVQQKVAPMTPMGDTTDPAQRFNQKFMMYGMPILFYFLFNNFSSGLVLYWTIFNVLTMVQQLYLTPKPKKA
jgi:YidC/Oxa1 family membrane protein insertase